MSGGCEEEMAGKKKTGRPYNGSGRVRERGLRGPPTESEPLLYNIHYVHTYTAHIHVYYNILPQNDSDVCVVRTHHACECVCERTTL